LLRNRANVVGVLGLSTECAGNVSGYTRLDDVAMANNIPYFEFKNINEPHIIHRIHQWNPDLFFVVGLSQLVKQDLLDIPRLGCVGFHPTWLPEGRGRAPVAWLVLDGRPGAATFFLMDAGIDSGPILVQEPFHVSDHDYASDVVEKLEDAIDRALDRWLPSLLKGEWNPQPQNDELASYNGRRSPGDGLIDWYKPAKDICRLIRAASRPHPGAYTYAKNEKLIVWRAEVENSLQIRGVVGQVLRISGDQGWLVQTGNGLLWLTETEFVDADPAPRVQAGIRLGYALQDEIYRIRRRLDRLEALLEEKEI